MITNDSGFLLHAKAYRENSVIADFLCRENGHVRMVCRGNKSLARRNKTRAVTLPQQFILYELGFRGKGDLKTLVSAEALGSALSFRGKSLYTVLYLNELLLKASKQLPFSNTIFDLYQHTLLGIGQDEETLLLEKRLRVFEFSLLSAAGMAIDFSTEVSSGQHITESKRYSYCAGFGFVEIRSLEHVRHRLGNVAVTPVISGKTIKAVSEGRFDDESRIFAKRLARVALTSIIGYERLKSRDLFA